MLFPLFSKENVCLPVSTRLLGVQQAQWVWWMKCCCSYKCFRKIVHCTAVCIQNKSTIQLLQFFKDSAATWPNRQWRNVQEMWICHIWVLHTLVQHMPACTCPHRSKDLTALLWSTTAVCMYAHGCEGQLESAAAPAAWAVKPTLYLLLFSFLDLI